LRNGINDKPISLRHWQQCSQVKKEEQAWVHTRTNEFALS
jgi:hypothetical protein